MTPVHTEEEAEREGMKGAEVGTVCLECTADMCARLVEIAW